MHRLAKAGFSQSYTYFAWRNTSWELSHYFTELGTEPIREFLRPNLWPNTPDILTEHLQTGGRPPFSTRLCLAPTPPAPPPHPRPPPTPPHTPPHNTAPQRHP